MLKPGRCLALHYEIPKLRRHGVDLLPVVERITQIPESLAHISELVLRTNLRELIVIYFEIADDNDRDYATFVRKLPDILLDHGVGAIRTVWGTNNDFRRTVMSLALYNHLCHRLPGDRLVTTLKRLIKIGQLTFDRNNPGKSALFRQFDSAKVILERARNALAESDDR